LFCVLSSYYNARRYIPLLPLPNSSLLLSIINRPISPLQPPNKQLKRKKYSRWVLAQDVACWETSKGMYSDKTFRFWVVLYDVGVTTVQRSEWTKFLPWRWGNWENENRYQAKHSTSPVGWKLKYAHYVLFNVPSSPWPRSNLISHFSFFC